MADQFRLWADRAVGQMRFAFDRAAVRQELLGHLEDREDDYVNQGLTTEQAQQKALQAMEDRTVQTWVETALKQVKFQKNRESIHRDFPAHM